MSPRPRRSSCLPVLPLLILSLLACPGLANAHTGTRTSLRVRRDGQEVTVRVEAANRELGDVLGLNDGDVEASRAQIDAAAARVFAMWSRALSVRATGKRCTPRDGGLQAGMRGSDYTTAQTLVFTCAGRTALELRYAWYFDRDPLHQAFVRARAPSGRLDAFLLDAEHRAHALDLEPTAADNIVDFGRSGIEHIFTGYDHIAFLLALLLMAGLKVGEQGLRPGLAYAAKVVTGFTLGHSVTLVLAAVGILHPPSRVIESAIAASILFVAVENILAKHPRPRALMTAGFGLIHGFGFAGVLAEQGLPREGLILSLVSFNVGIELGQLVIVVLLVLPLALSARRTWFRPAMLVPGSLVIAAFGAIWLAERLMGFKVLPI